MCLPVCKAVGVMFAGNRHVRHRGEHAVQPPVLCQRERHAGGLPAGCLVHGQQHLRCALRRRHPEQRGVYMSLQLAIKADVALTLLQTTNCYHGKLLLSHWRHACDGVQVAGRLAAGHVAYTLLLNQTAIHGVPAAINAANSALLRAFTGNANASMRVTNYPLPTVSDEDAVKVSQMSGKRGRSPGRLTLCCALHARHACKLLAAH